IEYLGRIDHQVKIRGYRIELGEIESVLAQHPMINEVVVTVREDQPGDKRLVAYLTYSQHELPNVNAIRLFLKEKLPEYMVPSAFVLLHKLPLTPNGKIDRKALPAPEQTRPEFEQSYVPPRSPMEEMLVSTWREVLNIDQIGIHDNFFELGGHSLLAVKMITEINKLFNTDLPLGVIFQSPTVEELGIIIECGNQQPSWYSLVPIQTQGSRPLLFAIHTGLQALPRHLGKDQPLYFLRYGIAAESSNHPVRLPLMEDLASHYIKELQQLQPHGPYYLTGFSFGGLIAYEMACQLVANGHRVNLLALLDTHLKWEKQSKPYHRIIHQLFKLSPRESLLQIKNKLDYLLTPEDQSTDFWPHIFKVGPDLACWKGYQTKPYKGRVILFQASERDSIFFTPIAPEQAWKELLGDRLEVQQLSGGHFDICSKMPHVKILAEKLMACMDKAVVGEICNHV
ncbi:MAG: thioesterase domain-containing protein, partial [bacterium]